MNEESKPREEPGADAAPPQAGAAPPGNQGPRQTTLIKLPGLAAISLYMMFLAGTVILGVVRGFFPRLFLVFPVLFLAAGMGLLMLLRWAWALTVAAVLLLLAIFLYQYGQDHAIPLLIQGLLNFVFFLYLVRTEVRSQLR